MKWMMKEITLHSSDFCLLQSILAALDYSDDPKHNLSSSAEGHGLSDKLYGYPVHGD